MCKVEASLNICWIGLNCSATLNTFAMWSGVEGRFCAGMRERACTPDGIATCGLARARPRRWRPSSSRAALRACPAGLGRAAATRPTSRRAPWPCRARESASGAHTPCRRLRGRRGARRPSAGRRRRRGASRPPGPARAPPPRPSTPSSAEAAPRRHPPEPSARRGHSARRRPAAPTRLRRAATPALARRLAPTSKFQPEKNIGKKNL